MLTKPRLNSTEVLVSKALIDSNISHVEFVSIYNVLKDSDDMKKEIKNSSDKQKLKIYVKHIYMLLHWLKCRKNTESKNTRVVKMQNGRIMLLSKCAVCETKNLSKSKIPLVDPLLI